MAKSIRVGKKQPRTSTKMIGRASTPINVKHTKGGGGSRSTK